MERYCPPGTARFVSANKISPKFKQVHETFLSPKLFSAKVKRFFGMLLIPGTRNGERGTGNGSLGTNVQRQPAGELKMAVKSAGQNKRKARRETIWVKVNFHRQCPQMASTFL